jgi:hypothetical protein
LLSPAFIAGLILGADEAVGPAAPFGRHADVAMGATDCHLDMTAFSLVGPENPPLIVGICEEAAQFFAMRAFTADSAGPDPVPRRLEGLRDPILQMRDAGQTQSLDRGRPTILSWPEQIANGRHQNFVETICRGPVEHVVRRAISEGGIDACERDERLRRWCRSSAGSGFSDRQDGGCE